MDTKKCSCCKRSLDYSCYHKNKARYDGVDTHCKECSSRKRKEAAKLKPIVWEQLELFRVCNSCNCEFPLNKSFFYFRKSHQTYRYYCIECVKRKVQINTAMNPDRKEAYNLYYHNQPAVKEKKKERYRKRRHIIREQTKMRESTDLQFKLTKVLRCRVYHALKKNFKGASTLKLLGCPVNFLKLHLQVRFYDRPDGTPMTWENYGKYGWHIDHIRPCASFDLSDPEQQRQCLHYSNLQPLWAEDNLSKRDKLNWSLS